ncbi:MAG: hypothetical protein KME40_17540 [Komarekiella atlantica HA4396-MV6]|jgi:hypothetical protein|nr:hypothetical protein [Komarekiella atlantica HA4396-MV6]
MDLTPGNLELHIEELILHGFPASDRHRIGAAVQQELTRLFTQGIPPSLSQGGAIAQLNGSIFEITPGTQPEIIGVQIAQSIYGGLSQ